MSDPRSYLESLPPEIFLPILNYLPDLESLDSLLRASPTAYRIFDDKGAAVFKAVLSSGNTHTYTYALIRIIALIRADALPPTVKDLTTFKDLVMHETSSHRWEPPRWVEPLTTLPSDITATVLRGLLATSRKVNRLVFGCLEYYLDRFKVLRPFHRATFSFDSMPFAEVLPDIIGPWQEKEANTIYYYPVHDIGPPSWVEQQRVLRVFWRIELSRALNTAVDASRIIWPQIKGFEGVNQMSSADLCHVGLIFFGERGGRVLDFEELMVRETLLEHELLESAIKYRQDTREIIPESTYWRLTKDWLHSSMPTNQKDWETLDVTYTSPMWEYFYDLTGTCLYHEVRRFTPLQHIKFAPFRPFGFAIWSMARMVGYGLLVPAEEYGVGAQVPYYEAWRNLLSQNEIDAVDSENEIKDAEVRDGG